MIPISDHNLTHIVPVLTWALIAACVVAFGYQVGGGMPFEQVVGEYGFIPARIFGHVDEHTDILVFPTAAWVTVFSSMFMHGDIMHLGGNMLYLYIFGDNIENALGRLRFILFYLITGVAAAFAQGILDPMSEVPMIGASGAISGILGGYLVLYPKQTVTVLIPNAGVQQMPALVVLGLWFGYQFLYGLLASGEGGGVAFWAHVGGFVAGAVLVKLFALGVDVGEKPKLWRE